MANALERILKTKTKQSKCVETIHLSAGAHMRHFDLYHMGDDRLLIQRDLFNDKKERRRSLILLKRSDLRIGKKGWLFIVVNGAFSAILTPLFSGRMGALCNVSQSRRSEVLTRRTVLGSFTLEGIDLLQRETLFEYLVDADAWLQTLGLGLNEISFPDKTPQLMQHMTRLGQEWRIRSMVYTYNEMLETVLRAWQYLDTSIHYCVSVKGVHYITYAEFLRITNLAATDQIDNVRDVLREWVALPPGQRVCNLRRIKHGSLHVIEFFGLRRSDAERYLIPALERLLEGMTIGRMLPADIHDTLRGIAMLYHSMLVNPAYASLRHEDTVKALYTLVTDHAIISLSENGGLAFDARRIALPGATFIDGIPHTHPGIDERTRTLITHLIARLSAHEAVEYINVYEVRSTKTLRAGQIREVVLKTNMDPLPESFVEKRLQSVRVGYAAYLLTRINVFRALGIAYPDHHLLATQSGMDGAKKKRETPFFLRSRCLGDPLHSIPKALFLVDPFCPTSAEDVDIVLRLAKLYGRAAAHNMVVKKYLVAERTCRFGIEKEIFEFAYDPLKRKLMPYRVKVCSIRGSMGWPNTEHTPENLEETYRFYLRVYANALGNYWREHAEACTLAETAHAFFDGFEEALAEVRWNYLSNKAGFDTFTPPLRDIFKFQEKFSFVLWALEHMSKDILTLRERFLDYVRDAFVKVER